MLIYIGEIHICGKFCWWEISRFPSKISFLLIYI